MDSKILEQHKIFSAKVAANPKIVEKSITLVMDEGIGLSTTNTSTGMPAAWIWSLGFAVVVLLSPTKRATLKRLFIFLHGFQLL